MHGRSGRQEGGGGLGGHLSLAAFVSASAHSQDSDCTSSVCMDWDTAQNAHGTLRDDTLATYKYYFGTCANPFEVEAVNINRRLTGAVNHIATALFKGLDTKPPVIPDTIAIDKTPLSYSDRDCVIKAFGACLLYFEYGVSFSINQAFNLQSVGLGIGLGAIGGSIFNGTNDFKHGETMDIALELKGSPYVSVTGNGYVSADGAKDSAEIDVTGSAVAWLEPDAFAGCLLEARALTERPLMHG